MRVRLARLPARHWSLAGICVQSYLCAAPYRLLKNASQRKLSGIRPLQGNSISFNRSLLFFFFFRERKPRTEIKLRGRCANQVTWSHAATQKRIRQSMETKAHGQAGEGLDGRTPGCRAIPIAAFHASARRSVWSVTFSRAHIGTQSQLFLAPFPYFFFFFFLRSP